MAPKKLKKRKAKCVKAQEPDAPSGVVAESIATEELVPEKAEKKAPAKVPPPKRRRGAAEAAEAAEAEGGEAAKVDRRGVIHLASIPLVMGFQKLRHLMEQFGEVGRVYLAPEEPRKQMSRKRAGGNRKVRYTEGWVEFMDRRIAKRVAATLHGSTIGGKKRHNFFRDDMWNMRYLPGFKWHMLKEGAIYDQQVRKARLQQKISQATRENSFYLESVEKAKTRQRIAERPAKKRHGAADAAPSGSSTAKPTAMVRPGGRPSTAGSNLTGGISDKVLNQLL
ncbi:unnamed protein product [Durusdinium trenchii]|uniref:Activator of basal transcription 1 n=1 Tax=Durusdinium trenchii TaxID=1381693 RepID=A0ABP0QPI9_9DINO